MSEFVKSKTVFVSDAEYIQNLVNANLKKDLHDNEEICQHCHGTGQIVVGYQGVGKSTLAYHNMNVIDLESSNFFVDGKRDEKWYIPYCNIARSLARQGYIVCISSHEVVRKELERNPTERQVIVYPALALKDAWIRSLKHRYEQTESDKDFKALKNAEQCYEQNITDLANQAGFEHIEITSMSYSLENMLIKREVQV